MSRFHYQDPKETERDPFDAEAVAASDEFAELLNAHSSAGTAKSFRMGDKVSGPVLRVSSEFIFVDLGGKNAGALLVEEFKNAKTDAVLPKIGDDVSAFVKKDNGSEILLTLMVGRTDGVDSQALQQAYQNRLPVEAKIEKVIKGGFEASVGKKRAFVPLSQLELSSVSEPEKYIGAVFQFLITEYSQGGRNIVLSRRVLLADERKRQGEEVLSKLDVGHTVKATIMRLAPIGAFVDIGGIDALIPLSEMSWKRVKRPEDVVKVGEVVEAKVIRLEREPKLRVALSLKDASDSAAMEAYKASPRSGSKDHQADDSSGSVLTGGSNPSSHNSLAEAFAKAISGKPKA